ncbi:IS66-like element accessory protein TnpA [Limobrevibacterium gyesilva]|uniref:Transposase n=1 Tax=Limobrevibacterium gyesilva TaxID=2991712 RepID=A0AA42CHP9_9PROT|nr:transposase [Limobrevibacterium gyesilva]
MEIITGVERRRRWRVEDKLRIVAEVEQPGACFAEIVRWHEVSRGLLWNWRRQVRSGALAPMAGLQFLPVHGIADSPVAEPPLSSKPSLARQPCPGRDATIEIVLPDGATVRVGCDVGAAALRRVLGVLCG